MNTTTLINNLNRQCIQYIPVIIENKKPLAWDPVEGFSHELEISSLDYYLKLLDLLNCVGIVTSKLFKEGSICQDK